MNYQVNGTSAFRIAYDGTVTTNSVTTIGGNLNVQGNVLPTLGGTFDLGSVSKPFANLYVDLIVSAIGMFNTMTIALLERTREIGIMKAIGIMDKDILRLFLADAVTIGF